MEAYTIVDLINKPIKEMIISAGLFAIRVL